MINKNKNLKFVSTDISVSFLKPFSKYKKVYALRGVSKTVSMENIKTLKNCEN